jgi:hypothetical protein
VADIKNYPSFNLRKEGVQVKVLEWFGDLAPYSVLQDVWIQMKGIPPKWCHWRVFAQIASSFGLMLEVDWSTLFKSFYEVIRVKASCKDSMKIPSDRLYEMDKKIFLVSFVVEREEDKEQKGKSTDDGGNDDDNPDNDDEADDLDDDDTEVEKPPPLEFQIGEKSRMRTPVTKQGPKTGHKTVSMEDVMMKIDQEKQLRSLMRSVDLVLLTATKSQYNGNMGCIDVTRDCVSKSTAVSRAMCDKDDNNMVLENQDRVRHVPILELTREKENSHIRLGQQIDFRHSGQPLVEHDVLHTVSEIPSQSVCQMSKLECSNLFEQLKVTSMENASSVKVLQLDKRCSLKMCMMSHTLRG